MRVSPFNSSRLMIWSRLQHPLKHDIGDLGYTNPALPSGNNSITDALNYLFAVLYPNTKDAVATPADLPTGTDTPNPGDVTPTINDYRIVLDDGDGKAAGYRYYKSEDDVTAIWHKIYDLDWSSESVLSQFLDVTQNLYVYQQGKTDRDEFGDPIIGVFAGQRIWGGDLTGQNLTLDANFVDDTGFVQVNSNFRPTVNNTWDLATNTERFKDGFLSGILTVGTLGISGGSITDSTGTISFSNENLITTGNITANTFIAGTLSIADGSITDSDGTISFGTTNITGTGTLGIGQTTVTTSGNSLVLQGAQITSSLGQISFGDENLLTTGTITGDLLNIDNIRLDGNSIVTTNTNGNLIISPNGTGLVDFLKQINTLNISTTGTHTITGQLNADNIRIDGNTISSLSGQIILDPATSILVDGNILANTATIDLGAAASEFRDIYLNNSIKDLTNTFLMTDLMQLRSTPFRDVARTVPAQTGDSLFYDATNDVWLASPPDTEITHGGLSGLTTGDSGHTQFVMLTGRAGGQVVQGGTAASENLILESTSDATKGRIFVRDNLTPETTASFSGTWQGKDLGDATRYFRDIYTRGEARGLRLENFTSASLPASSAQNVGRVVYSTDDEKIYVDTGTSFITPSGGANKYAQDIVFDGIVTVTNVDVSSQITDARTAIIQLLDNANDFERIYTNIKATSASNVRITTSPALPAGSYRLIVIE